jgi:hypothetical protein
VIKSVVGTDEYPSPARRSKGEKKRAIAEAEAARRRAKKLVRQQDQAWREKQKRIKK